MKNGNKWQVGLFAGTMALGMAWGGVSVASAQEAAQQDGQQAAAQQDGQGRRGRGQGRGQGGAGGIGVRNPEQAVEQYREQVYALNLSEEQKTKLDPIFKEQAEKAKTLASEVEGLQGRERMEKTMGFAREMREKVNGVLTEEQRTTFRKNQASRMAKQSVERYRRATADLGLSDDQKTKLDAVLTESEKKYAEALAAAPEGGGQGGGFGGGQLREVNQETREKINALLTDEQKTKFEEATRGGRGGQGGGRRGGQGGNQQ